MASGYSSTIPRDQVQATQNVTRAMVEKVEVTHESITNKPAAVTNKT